MEATILFLVIFGSLAGLTWWATRDRAPEQAIRLPVISVEKAKVPAKAPVAAQPEKMRRRKPHWVWKTRLRRARKFRRQEVKRNRHIVRTAA